MLNEIKEIKSGRHTTILKIPDHMRDDRLNMKAGHMYTIKSAAEITGKSSFENKPVRITLSPAQDYPVFEFTEPLRLDPDLCVKGQHNIQLGEIKIIEHPLSVMTALNVDFNLKIDQGSFPTFDYCNKPYIDVLENNLIDLGESRAFTVKEPVYKKFGDGYCILEPDEGADALKIDHQVRYPGDSIGTTRLVTTLDAGLYTFLCAARTPSFKTKEENKKNYEMVTSGMVKDYPVSAENVLFVDEFEFYNPRKEFLYDGINYEFMMHEIIDIIAWLKFLELSHNGRFVGTMTTFLFDHHSQIDMAQYACKDVEIVWS